MPAGRYAVEIDGVLGFFKVDCPTEGRWAGYVFVKQMASDTEYAVRGFRLRLVLDAIAADPQAASVSVRPGDREVRSLWPYAHQRGKPRRRYRPDLPWRTRLVIAEEWARG